jgi:hypothetical protein
MIIPGSGIHTLDELKQIPVGVTREDARITE